MRSPRRARGRAAHIAGRAGCAVYEPTTRSRASRQRHLPGEQLRRQCPTPALASPHPPSSHGDQCALEPLPFASHSPALYEHNEINDLYDDQLAQASPERLRTVELPPGTNAIHVTAVPPCGLADGPTAPQRARSDHAGNEAHADIRRSRERSRVSERTGHKAARSQQTFATPRAAGTGRRAISTL